MSRTGFKNTSVSQLSLAQNQNPYADIPEIWIPLWNYSAGYYSTTSTTGVYLNLGNTTGGSNLITLGNWDTSIAKFAIEAYIYSTSGGSTATLQIYDVTSTATVVSGASLSATVNAPAIARSAKFSLNAGKQYAIMLSTSSASYTAYATDIKLVVFPNG